MPDETPPKKKKTLLSLKKNITNNYSKYSGVIDDDGKPIDNPTVEQSIKTMVKYMKKNQSDQGENPSNTYRPEFQQTSLLYKKKPNTNA